MIEKTICLILSALIFFQAFALRQFVGSWIVPGSIFGIFWFFFTFIPLALVPSAPADPLAIAYILLSCVVVSLGSITVKWKEAFQKNANLGPVAIRQYDTKFLTWTFYICAFLAIVCWLLNVQAQGISLSRITEDFFSVSNEYILNRYSNSLVASIFSQLSNVFSYTAAAIGGLIVSGRKKFTFQIFVTLFSFIPSILVLTVQGAKGMIFLSISLFYGGWLVRRMKSDDRRLVDTSLVKRALVGTALLIPFVTISFLARGAYQSQNIDDVFDALTRYYVSYTSVHIYAFSDWFSWYIGNDAQQFYSEEPKSLGFYTFMAIFKLLGSDKYVPPGVFDEYYAYGNYLGGNLYTFYRGLITDYGIFGSLVVLFGMSLIFHWVTQVVLVKSLPTASVSFFIMMMGFIYTSFIISLLIWNSVFGVFIILWMILSLNILQLRLAETAHDVKETNT